MRFSAASETHARPSYGTLRSIPSGTVTFSGLPHEDPASWLRQLERSATFEGWTDHQLLCRACASLCGDAATWLDTVEICRWNDFKSLFTHRFAPSIDALWSQFRRVRQHKREPVAEYADRFQMLTAKLAAQMASLPPSLSLRQFINGLRQPLRDHVFTFHPNTIEEAREEAQYAEQFSYTTSSPGTHEPVVQSCAVQMQNNDSYFADAKEQKVQAIRDEMQVLELQIALCHLRAQVEDLQAANADYSVDDAPCSADCFDADYSIDDAPCSADCSDADYSADVAPFSADCFDVAYVEEEAFESEEHYVSSVDACLCAGDADSDIMTKGHCNAYYAWPRQTSAAFTAVTSLYPCNSKQGLTESANMTQDYDPSKRLQMLEHTPTTPSTMELPPTLPDDAKGSPLVPGHLTTAKLVQQPAASPAVIDVTVPAGEPPSTDHSGVQPQIPASVGLSRPGSLRQEQCPDRLAKSATAVSNATILIDSDEQVAAVTTANEAADVICVQEQLLTAHKPAYTPATDAEVTVVDSAINLPVPLAHLDSKCCIWNKQTLDVIQSITTVQTIDIIHLGHSLECTAPLQASAPTYIGKLRMSCMTARSFIHKKAAGPVAVSFYMMLLGALTVLLTLIRAPPSRLLSTCTCHHAFDPGGGVTRDALLHTPHQVWAEQLCGHDDQLDLCHDMAPCNLEVDGMEQPRISTVEEDGGATGRRSCGACGAAVYLICGELPGGICCHQAESKTAS